jgi:hypothetical protein
VRFFRAASLAYLITGVVVVEVVFVYPGIGQLFVDSVKFATSLWCRRADLAGGVYFVKPDSTSVHHLQPTSEASTSGFVWFAIVIAGLLVAAYVFRLAGRLSPVRTGSDTTCVGV